MLPKRFEFTVVSTSISCNQNGVIASRDVSIQDVEDIRVVKSPRPVATTIDQSGNVHISKVQFPISIDTGKPVIPHQVIGSEIIDKVKEKATYDAISKARKENVAHDLIKLDSERHKADKQAREALDSKLNNTFEKIITENKHGSKTDHALREVNSKRLHHFNESNVECQMAADGHKVIPIALKPRELSETIAYAIESVKFEENLEEGLFDIEREFRQQYKDSYDSQNDSGSEESDTRPRNRRKSSKRVGGMSTKSVRIKQENSIASSSKSTPKSTSLAASSSIATETVSNESPRYTHATVAGSALAKKLAILEKEIGKDRNEQENLFHNVAAGLQSLMISRAGGQHAEGDADAAHTEHTENGPNYVKDRRQGVFLIPQKSQAASASLVASRTAAAASSKPQTPVRTPSKPHTPAPSSARLNQNQSNSQNQSIAGRIRSFQQKTDSMQTTGSNQAAAVVDANQPASKVASTTTATKLPRKQSLIKQMKDSKQQLQKSEQLLSSADNDAHSSTSSDYLDQQQQQTKLIVSPTQAITIIAEENEDNSTVSSSNGSNSQSNAGDKATNAATALITPSVESPSHRQSGRGNVNTNKTKIIKTRKVIKEYKDSTPGPTVVYLNSVCNVPNRLMSYASIAMQPPNHTYSDYEMATAAKTLAHRKQLGQHFVPKSEDVIKNIVNPISLGVSQEDVDNVQDNLKFASIATKFRKDLEKSFNAQLSSSNQSIDSCKTSALRLLETLVDCRQSRLLVETKTVYELQSKKYVRPRTLNYRLAHTLANEGVKLSDIELHDLAQVESRPSDQPEGQRDAMAASSTRASVFLTELTRPVMEGDKSQSQRDQGNSSETNATSVAKSNAFNAFIAEKSPFGNAYVANFLYFNNLMAEIDSEDQQKHISENIWFVGLIVLVKKKLSVTPTPQSIFKLLTAIKSLIVLGIKMSKDIVYALIDEFISTEDHNSKIVFTIINLLCKRVGIDPESLYRHFQQLGKEASARLIQQVETIQSSRQSRLEQEKKLNSSRSRRTFRSRSNAVATDMDVEHDETPSATPSSRKIRFDFDNDFMSDSPTALPSRLSVRSNSTAALHPSSFSSSTSPSSSTPRKPSLWQPEFRIPRHEEYQLGDMKKVFALITDKLKDLNIHALDISEFFSQL